MVMKTALCRDVIRSYRGNHADIAKVFHAIYSDMFTVQIQQGKPVLFQRDSIDKEWRDGNVIYIKRLLSTRLSNLYCQVAHFLFTAAFNDDHELVKPKHLDVANALIRIATLLKNETYKNNITKAIIEILVM